MKLKNLLFDDIAVKRALTRLSYEIIERSPDIENTVLIGIKTRGVPLAKIISENLNKNSGVSVPVLELDITHYRDDVKKEIEVSDTLKKSDVEGKDVILVDDVLFTGRTTRAAIDAVFSAGRARNLPKRKACSAPRRRNSRRQSATPSWAKAPLRASGRTARRSKSI